LVVSAGSAILSSSRVRVFVQIILHLNSAKTQDRDVVKLVQFIGAAQRELYLTCLDNSHIKLLIYLADN